MPGEQDRIIVELLLPEILLCFSPEFTIYDKNGGCAKLTVEDRDIIRSIQCKTMKYKALTIISLAIFASCGSNEPETLPDDERFLSAHFVQDYFIPGSVTIEE